MDIRTLCLGLLTLRDASGYEIKKAFEGELSYFYEASYGSIYPALNRLTGEGLLSCTAQAQEKRPDKKVYRITPKGRIAFMDELTKRPGRDRVRSDFIAIMMFADLLPVRHLSDLMDERIVEYRRSLDALRRAVCDTRSPGSRFVLGYGIAIFEAAVTYLEENRHLVEGEALLGPSAAADD